MTKSRAYIISAIVSVILVIVGRILLAMDSAVGIALLSPGAVVEMFRVGGVHGSSHSQLLTELCTVGTSLAAWFFLVLVLLAIRRAVLEFMRRKK